MTDRDTFAAAALTGLLFHNHEPPKPVAWWVEQAYDYADAMLRQRGIAERDNCVAGNPEIPCPVTNPLPKEKLAEVSDSEPVAWAVMESDGFGIDGTFQHRDEAAEWCDDRQQIVPLYRHPQPSLTDAEREAVEAAIAYMAPVGNYDSRVQATLRGLLERL